MAEYIIDVTGFIEEYEIETHNPDWAKERIVRCMDCVQFIKFSEKSDLSGYGYCMKMYDIDNETSFCKTSGFCAWGEPKEGE